MQCDLRAYGAKVCAKVNFTVHSFTFSHTFSHSNLNIFFCPFKSFLVTQSNLNKWRGATPPSGMVLFTKYKVPSIGRQQKWYVCTKDISLGSSALQVNTFYKVDI